MMIRRMTPCTFLLSGALPIENGPPALFAFRFMFELILPAMVVGA